MQVSHRMTTTRPHQNVPQTGIIHMISHIGTFVIVGIIRMLGIFGMLRICGVFGEYLGIFGNMQNMCDM